MPTGSSPRKSVARLRRPGELANLVPMLCGFVPTESLVVICLRGGKRNRIGLTMRVDLPDAADVTAEADLVEQLLQRLTFDGGGGAFLAIYTAGADHGQALPRRALVDALCQGSRRRGVEVLDALLVRGGRWWSYRCDDQTCCPAVGTPLDVAPSAALALVAAEQALDGRAVLDSRTALVASLAGPTGLAAAAARQRLSAASSARARQVAREGRVQVGQDALRLWRRALSLAESPAGADEPPQELSPSGLAPLILSLDDVLVRDEILTWALEDDAALLRLLLLLARECVPPFDTATCTCIAWVAHLRGDGALANVALDRALAGDPGYAMARLCRQALDAQVRPAQVRSLLAESRQVLHDVHPWTTGTEPG